MNLAEHNKWLSLQNFNPGTTAEICQCGSEKAIQRSSDPERMRAELLSYVFLDQFFYSHYPEIHSLFKKEYPGPKLRQHSFGGHASPSWFVYSKHNYDANADWEFIQSVFWEYLSSGLEWLSKNCNIDEEKFWLLAQEEIKNEFEIEHQCILMSAVRNAL